MPDPSPPTLTVLNSQLLTASSAGYLTYSASQKIPTAACSFLTFFSQTVENFKSIFIHLLHVPIYAILQIFIQLFQILTKLMPY